MFGYDPFNLDDFSHEPADLKIMADLFGQLAMYTRLRLKAIESRRKGFTNTAANAERNADAVYETLPDWAKW